MNDTFSLKRFWTYFKYDLTQLARRNGRTYAYIAGSGLFLYFFVILTSLIFKGEWHTPDLGLRVAGFIVMFTVLELLQARTYGHLTERKAGSAWLMVPASRLEKFVSMLLIVLILIPLFYVCGYLLIDAFLSLVDPTVGDAIVTHFSGGLSSLIMSLKEMGGTSPITVTPGNTLGMALIGLFCNFLFFLLCGLCFKKNKIGGGLLIILGFTMLFSTLGMLLAIPGFHGMVDMSEQEAIEMATRLLNGSVIVSCLLTVGLGWGVWRRIKTLQH